jgi:uncharacterized LabA/DUF88 family protein
MTKVLTYSKKYCLFSNAFYHHIQVILYRHFSSIEKPGSFIMRFSPTERTALFIDGANLYAATRSLGIDIDYRRLLDYFGSRLNLVRAYYYSALLDTEEYSPLKPLTDWLAYNGYSLVTKPAKEFTDALGRRRIKGNMDIELAIDMLELSAKLDHAILFSGDSDFRRLVEATQRKGVRVTVISTIKTSPPMIADELRRQADQYVELADIASEFSRKPSEMRHRAPTREDE